VESRRYVITLRGRLSERFAASFEGLTLEAGDGVTTLSGVLHDQAQLYGVLERVADCGLELAGVQEQDADESQPASHSVISKGSTSNVHTRA
jgi:hypothetical protein